MYNRKTIESVSKKNPGTHGFISILVFLFSFLINSTSAQFKLELNIRSLPATHYQDSIFIAGNFNGWNPHHGKYYFNCRKDVCTLTFSGLAAGEYQFKFTRGDWSKVESASNGGDVSNRIISLNSDTSIDCSIAGWKDDFVQQLMHTASPGVSVMDTAFYMPQLNRHRRIWIYLPPGYEKSKKQYPVLYMHDGQNLFDNYVAAYGEWNVDETIDSLVESGKPGCIVVGIDNGSERVQEYNPYNNDKYGVGEGTQYVSFIAETLKPYIDKHYRTLSSKENCFIAGSSVGGLISYYAMLRYPAVFGKVGIFSPSFWIAPEINALTDSVNISMNGQFFMYAGGEESEEMVPDMLKVADTLAERSSSLVYLVTDPLGKHNEASWRKWFPEFYLWIMGNGLSYQVDMGK